MPTAGRPALGWTLSQGSLSGVTGVVALTGWSVGTQTGTWTLVSPGTSQASIVAPLLPSGSSAFAPAAGATFTTPTVYAVTMTAPLGYGHVLGMASSFWPLGGCVSGPFLPPLPATGTAVVSIFANALGC